MNKTVKMNSLIYLLHNKLRLYCHPRMGLILLAIGIQFLLLTPSICKGLDLNNMTISGEQPYSESFIDIYNVDITPTGQSRMVAENYIKIHSGFHAQAGSQFSARTTPNPTWGTIRGSYGSPDVNDYYINAARLFLFGDCYPGSGTSTTIANFCPWPDNNKELIHVRADPVTGFSPPKLDAWGDTSNFFTTTNDLDPDDGIDRAMVLFYMGHGTEIGGDGGPHGFRALTGKVDPRDMFVGDGDPSAGIGGLRYLIFSSCRLFCHGPLDWNNDGHNDDYIRPDLFDGSPDSDPMRNVYERWGPALSDNVRMACGQTEMSSGPPDTLDQYWDDYNNNGFGVVDAWLFHREADVNICITRGGDKYNLTPFVTDTRFNNKANPGGPNLFIVFRLRDGTIGDQDNKTGVSFEIPDQLPIMRIIKENSRRQVKTTIKHQNSVTGQDIELQQKHNGMIAIGRKMDVYENDILLTSDQYIRKSREFLEGENWYNDGLGEPKIYRKMVQKATIKQEKIEKVKNFQAGVMIEYPGRFTLGKNKITVLGNALNTKILMNNDGTVELASTTWTDATPLRGANNEIVYERITTFEEAYQKALSQLPDSWNYSLESSKWGYKKVKESADETLFKVFYEFNFNRYSSNKREYDEKRTILIHAAR